METEETTVPTGGLSRSTVLLASGIVASSIVVAAYLLRPRTPCRAPTTIRFSTDWWRQTVEAIGSRDRDRSAPPPPIILPDLAEGCVYG